MAKGRRRKSSNCLTPGCKKKGDHSRGNCADCYERYRLAVKNGETTWQALEEQGATAERFASSKLNPAALVIATVSEQQASTP